MVKKVIENYYSYILIVCVSLPFLLALWTNEYQPGNDESWQLQAAHRLAAGEGYNSTRNILNQTFELSVGKYSYLPDWPPGYSLLIALHMQFGLTMDTAAKFIKSFFILLALFFWYRLSKQILQTVFFQLTFILFISVIIIDNQGSTTDIMSLALIPYLFGFFYSPKIKPSRLLIPGTIIAILIFVKYTNLVFVLVFSLLIFLSNFKEIKTVVIKVFMFSVLPLTTYGFISLTNKIYASQSVFLNRGSYSLDFFADIHWMLFSFYYFLKNIFIQPLHIHNVLDLLVSKPEIKFLCIATITLITTFLFIVLVYKQQKTDTHFQPSVLLLIAAVIGQIVFFFFLAGFVYEQSKTTHFFQNWPFIRFRYSMFLALFVFLLFLRTIEFHASKKIKFKAVHLKIILVFFILTALVGQSSNAYEMHHNFRKYTNQKQTLIKKINRIKSNHSNSDLIVFAHSSASKMLIAQNIFYTLRLPNPKNNYQFKNQTIVVCIESDKSNLSFPFKISYKKYNFQKLN